ncbi:MAG: hypothetical protein ABW215_00320 [Kibdelosporangium sp.]
MAATKGCHQPARLMLALLAAFLVASGIFGPQQGGDVAAGSGDEGATVASPAPHAVAPVRVVGRLAADPSLLKVHSPADDLPAGTAPSFAPVPALMRLGGQHAGATPVAAAEQRPAAGDRAPPVRQVDL